MLEKDAQCDHAHLSKLFDSMIVYCKDKSALKRLDEIRRKAAELLASDKRYEKTDKAYNDAKKLLAEVYLAQSLSKGRNSEKMNLLSLQWMFYEITESIAVDGFEIMDKFNPKNLEENVEVFN